jgi:hypothetical protein
MKSHPVPFLLFRSTCQFCALLAATIAFGCSGGSVRQDASDDPTLTQCVDPRPEVCTHEYRPVCGESEDGSMKTYGNACGACSHQEVTGHRPGEC